MNNEELIKKYWNYNKFGNLDDALGDGLRELMDKVRLDEREKNKLPATKVTGITAVTSARHRI